ncbi:hypothetical protein [Actinocorallia populi]|uniref:hypothetical protein n=1 Tax=Actinocorallia populi TaxID=2079200 RepID=UPI000D0871F7|nr:hypothetical protein [Actinocorallia populi]
MKSSSFAFVAAPVLVTVYGVVRLLDGLDGERGPGLAWTAGHLAFFASLLLFVPVLWELRRLAGRGAFATVTAVCATVGVVCALVQIGIDLVVGALAADHDDMSRMFSEVQDVPGVEIAVYAAGPMLFFLGLVVAACHLAVVRAVPVLQAAAVVLGVLAAAAGLDLLPVAGLLLITGLAPLARRSAPAVSLPA